MQPRNISKESIKNLLLSYAWTYQDNFVIIVCHEGFYFVETSGPLD